MWSSRDGRWNSRSKRARLSNAGTSIRRGRQGGIVGRGDPLGVGDELRVLEDHTFGLRDHVRISSATWPGVSSVVSSTCMSQVPAAAGGGRPPSPPPPLPPPPPPPP